MSVRADNDAFDFWLPAYDRPDEEYTSGVRGSLVYAGLAPWERWFHRGVTTCAVGADRCATHSYSFGQDIYTGALVFNDTTKIPGTRPNAGWLYVQESSRVMDRNRLDESSVTIGVTGPPALAEGTQHIVHSIAPYYNRPVNWDSQLPFEPGIDLAYDRTQRVLAFGDGKLFGGDIEPHAGASLGNILTEARAGLRVRTGFRLHHPWLLSAPTSAPEIALFADATEHGVARNEFLAGTMFRSSDHVQERPFVAEYQVGVSIRWKQVTFSWMADELASEYESRAQGHAWSRLALEWQFKQ